MGDAISDWVVPVVIAALSGGGGFWAWLQSRRSKDQGVTSRDIVEADQADSLALKLYRSQQDQIDAIKAERARDHERHKAEQAEVQEQIAALRDDYNVLLGVIRGVRDRLHQIPPLTPKDVLAYIAEHLPFLGKDDSHG